MNAQTILLAVFWVLPVVFGAGIAWLTIQTTRNDMKGLSKKFNRIVGLLTRWADTDEKRNAIAAFLEGK